MFLDSACALRGAGEGTGSLGILPKIARRKQPPVFLGSPLRFAPDG